MGAGKTATARALQKLLPSCALLDGDDVWNFTPFRVNEKTKELAFCNIAAVLNNYLACGLFENIVFCWVMQQMEIAEEICRRLRGDYTLRPFTLCVSEPVLRARLGRDIAKAGGTRACLPARSNGCRCTGTTPPNTFLRTERRPKKPPPRSRGGSHDPPRRAQRRRKPKRGTYHGRKDKRSAHVRQAQTALYRPRL